jgi:hypothetical protein
MGTLHCNRHSRLQPNDVMSSLVMTATDMDLRYRLMQELPAGYVSDGAADRAQRRRATDDSEFSSSHSR